MPEAYPAWRPRPGSEGRLGVTATAWVERWTRSLFVDAVAEEINEMLQASGQLAIGDLYKRFGLPLDYLSQLIDARLGRGIDGQRDAGANATLYTQAFVARQRAVVRGVALAVTRCARTSAGRLAVALGARTRF